MHETARRSINVLDEIAERRAIVVAFAKVEGLEAAFEARRGGLDAVQRCLTVAYEVRTRRAPIHSSRVLRQSQLYVACLCCLRSCSHHCHDLHRRCQTPCR